MQQRNQQGLATQLLVPIRRSNAQYRCVTGVSGQSMPSCMSNNPWSSSLILTVKRRHRKFHERPFSCGACNLCFQEARGLERHRQTQKHIRAVSAHGTIMQPPRNFKCPFCTYSRPRKDRVDAHQRAKHQRQMIKDTEQYEI